MNGFHWTPDKVVKAGALNLLESGHWSAYPPYSCAISLDPFAVQLGSTVKFQRDNTPWDLQSPYFFNDPNLKTHQGRFYSDGTFVVCSNRGIDMRYWDPQKGDIVWVHDATHEGEIAQKIPLHNGGMYKALSDGLVTI